MEKKKIFAKLDHTTLVLSTETARAERNLKGEVEVCVSLG